MAAFSAATTSFGKARSEVPESTIAAQWCGPAHAAVPAPAAAAALCPWSGPSEAPQPSAPPMVTTRSPAELAVCERAQWCSPIDSRVV